jgi:hypothetical protein
MYDLPLGNRNFEVMRAVGDRSFEVMRLLDKDAVST